MNQRQNRQMEADLLRLTQQFTSIAHWLSIKPGALWIKSFKEKNRHRVVEVIVDANNPNDPTFSLNEGAVFFFANMYRHPETEEWYISDVCYDGHTLIVESLPDKTNMGYERNLWLELNYMQGTALLAIANTNQTLLQILDYTNVRIYPNQTEKRTYTVTFQTKGFNGEEDSKEVTVLLDELLSAQCVLFGDETKHEWSPLTGQWLKYEISEIQA
ncbi:hypothetical protein KAZ57_01555 [Patescibacteria group bacterium]|nr:hypothetical protein [Patescibacteria group bacterium]